MRYPVYLHIGDEGRAHGFTIPDFPGCFSTAGCWEDLPRMIQEAAELYFERQGMRVPPPSPIERLAQNPMYQGGVWIFAEIDVSRLHPDRFSELPARTDSTMPPFVKDVAEPCQEVPPELPQPERVELALPEDLLKVIDDFARNHSLTRSSVMARAAEKFMEELNRKKR